MIGSWLFLLFLSKMQFLLSLFACNILSHWEHRVHGLVLNNLSIRHFGLFSPMESVRDKCALFAISLVQCHKLARTFVYPIRWFEAVYPLVHVWYICFSSSKQVVKKFVSSSINQQAHSAYWCKHAKDSNMQRKNICKIPPTEQIIDYVL